MGEKPGNNGTIYERIVIVGVGLIGGSLGLSVRRRFPGVTVIGVSSRAAVTSAVEMGAIDEGYGYEELAAAARDADLVVLCTPIHRIQGLLTVLAPIVTARRNGRSRVTRPTCFPTAYTSSAATP